MIYTCPICHEEKEVSPLGYFVEIMRFEGVCSLCHQRKITALPTKTAIIMRLSLTLVALAVYLLFLYLYATLKNVMITLILGVFMGAILLFLDHLFFYHIALKRRE
jgi:hypothetical protein